MKDCEGKTIKKGDIVENWQGRRAIVESHNKALVMRDRDGELKTPVKVVGKEGDAMSMERGNRPDWYRGMNRG